jgi:1-acyl-sn-glycerol-3-phosphate acyltransferase
MIALSFATFLIFKKIPFKNQKIIVGLLYDIFVWFVMNLVFLLFTSTHFYGRRNLEKYGDIDGLCRFAYFINYS